jgi:hypothetical protein
VSDPSSQSPISGLRDRLEAAGFHPIGTLFVAVGGLFVLAADTVLNWFRGGTGFFAGAGSNSTFSDLHDLLEHRARDVANNELSGYVTFGVSRDYFGWLGWLLLLGALAFGALAVSPFGRAHFTVRWFAAVVAATGMGLTFLALNLITFEGNAPNNANAPTYGDFFAHSAFGAWFAALGFLFVMVGSLLARGGR